MGSGQFDAYGYLRSVGAQQRAGLGLSFESRLSESWAGYGSLEAGGVYQDGYSELELAALMGFRARW